MSTTKETSGSGQSGNQAESSENEMKKLLQANPGVSRDLGEPGARKYVAELRRWRRRDYGLMLLDSDDGMCGAVVLVHEINSVRGWVVAHCYCQKTLQNAPCSG